MVHLFTFRERTRARRQGRGRLQAGTVRAGWPWAGSPVPARRVGLSRDLAALQHAFHRTGAAIEGNAIPRLVPAVVSESPPAPAGKDTDTRRRLRLDPAHCDLIHWDLEPKPRLIEPQEQDVTVLFCDMADFTPLAERLGPRTTSGLVADVMDRLTARIGENQGTVVDYYGDGMLAMWNASGEHAVRACQAALAIQTEVPRLSLAWAEVVGAPLKLRCSLNSGPALVGNTGSQQRFKYGPMGHTINLAQRVQAAGKYFGLPVLITGATRARLTSSFALRRLCRARLPRLCGEVDLFELHQGDPAWPARRDAYEQALALFETGQWEDACRAVQILLDLPKGRHDLPTLHLLARAVEFLKSPPVHFCSTWDLCDR